MPLETLVAERFPALTRSWSALEGARPRLAAVLKTAAVALQFGGVVVSIHLFDLVSRGFLFLSVLTFFGFLVHSLLPQSYRIHVFAALSLAGLVLVLKPLTAAWTLGLGLALIGIALLPLSLIWRAVLLVAIGGLLGYLRVPGSDGAVPAAVWPVLGSMFMFRLIIFLYDSRTEKQKPSFSWILSYFFLLPNVCFPLFPVVDYKKFRASHYTEDAHRIYQRGVVWMFRGAYQLVLYRLIYYYWSVNPTQVTGTADFAQFALSSFFLYLRVSGQFHLIVGMLLLFGFNLPETHHLYYLASSFNDFWRRINIYWKDFMMKIFYYPTFFRMRRVGPTAALVVSTCVVFAATWFLHTYQWFWLRGTWLLAWHDALFWAILGALVVVNSLWEQKHGRERSLGKKSRSLPALGALAARTAATFVAICLLWSLWTADSLAQWVAMLQTTGAGAVVIFLLAPALYLLAAVLQRLARRGGERAAAGPPARRQPTFWGAATTNAAGIAVLCLLATPAVYKYFGPGGVKLVESLRTSQLNQRDLELLERGYYEALLGVNPQNAELWELYNKRPIDWQPIQESQAWQPTDDILMGGLKPGMSFDFKGATLTVNRWGLRDQDYEEAKDEGTLRVAILGSSHVMGSGVGDGRTFEALVEERLNAEVDEPPYSRFEILNFATAARSSVQQLYLLETRVMRFDPDVVVLVAHGQDDQIINRYLSRLAASGIDIPYPFLRDVFRGAAVGPGLPEAVIQSRLRPHVQGIIDWSYGEITALCQKRGALPLWIYLPMVYEDAEPHTVTQRIEHARASGFATINLAEVYGGHDEAALRVATWDNHPNELAHRLIADQLYPPLVDTLRHVAARRREGAPAVASTAPSNGPVHESGGS